MNQEALCYGGRLAAYTNIFADLFLRIMEQKSLAEPSANISIKVFCTVWMRDGIHKTDRSEYDTAYDVRIEPTVKTQFHGIELHACGPWSQGPMLPQTLNVLAGYDLKAMGHNSPAYIHHLTEALKLSFADRHRYYGDPQFIDVPLETLLSGEYAAARRKLIRNSEAWPEMPPAGDLKGYPRATAMPRPTAGEPAPLADTSPQA